MKCTGLVWPGVPQEVEELCRNKEKGGTPDKGKTPKYLCRECNRGFYRIDMLNQHEEKCCLKEGGDADLPRVEPASQGLDPQL